MQDGVSRKHGVPNEENVNHIFSTIKLNIGGHYFTTSRQTLTKDPESELAAIFSSRSKFIECEDGAFFIDRDGTHFRFILNYLRTGKSVLPEGATALSQLLEEAKFYQIKELLDELNLVASKTEGRVRINVGGHYFTTTRQTLTKDPNSMLGVMFSGKFDMKPAEDGAFFIDRDGTHFRFILNYLRTGKLTFPEGEKAFKELQEEAEYYQIKGILDELEFNSEIITNDNHRSLLLRWLPPQDTQERRRRLRLLFRASQDGFMAETFHSKCDNKGPTVTIVKSGKYIFGGFTEESWGSQGDYTRCTEAFLFSMVSPSGSEPTKMPLKRESQYAICCRSDYGPTFGLGRDGHDLHISGKANISASSSVCLGETYNNPTYNDPESKADLFFTGKTHFHVTNYEVLELVN